MSFLNNLPEGFHSATNSLNNFENLEIITSIIEEIVKYLNKKGLGCYLDDFFDLSQKLGLNIDKSDLKNIINLLSFIFSEAYKFQVDKDDFPKLIRQNTQVKIDLIKLMHSYYQTPVFFLFFNFFLGF
jgi:hypothetical protein